MLGFFDCSGEIHCREYRHLKYIRAGIAAVMICITEGHPEPMCLGLFPINHFSRCVLWQSVVSWFYLRS